MTKWEDFKEKFTKKDNSIVNTVLFLGSDKSGEATVHMPFGCYQVRISSGPHFGLEALSDDFTIYVLKPEMIDDFRLACREHVLAEKKRVLARMKEMLRFKQGCYERTANEMLAKGMA